MIITAQNVHDTCHVVKIIDFDDDSPAVRRASSVTFSDS